MQKQFKEVLKVKRLLVITSVMIIMVGFIFVSCSNMDHTNLYDPAANYYEPPVPPKLTLSPTTPQDLRNWMGGQTIQFTAEGGTPPYTWTIIEYDDMYGPTPTISKNGLFTEGPSAGTMQGTCKVKVTDSNNQTATSGLITFDQA